MSIPAGAGPAPDWPIASDDPFLAADQIPAGVDAHGLSRFGEPAWNLSPLSSDAHASAVVVSWDRYQDPALCSSIRRAGWCLINLPTPEELLERKATSRVLWRSPGTVYGYLTQLRGFVNWLTGRGIGALAEVSEDNLEDYALHVQALGYDTATKILYSISLLWGYAPHLPAADRIPMPPWEAGARHRGEYRLARERLGTYLALPVDAIVTEKRTPLEIGRGATRYTQKDHRDHHRQGGFARRSDKPGGPLGDVEVGLPGTCAFGLSPDGIRSRVG